MPPAFPERMLAAIAALVWTPTGKLHDNGPTISPIAIVRQIDKLPAHPKGVEVLDDRGRCGRAAHILVPKGNPRHLAERRIAFEGLDYPQDRLLAFAADDDIDLRLLGQNLAPVKVGNTPP